MRRTTLFALFGLAAMPGIAVAQTTTSPSTTTTTTTTQPQNGMGMHGDHHWSMHCHHHWRHHARWMLRRFHKKFDEANTTHNGHLTLAQAEKAGMKPIVANFAAIDTQHRGYVTFNDIVAWRLDTMAARLEKRAAELRAKD